MMVKISKGLNIAVFFGLLVAVCLVINGCDAGSNEPIATALSTGSGYRIQLASSVESVAVNGGAVITAVIYEPDGSPIRDNEDVFFVSSEGGSFSDSPVKTINGAATSVYTAGDTPMKFDSISASCRGATAIIQLWVVPGNF